MARERKTGKVEPIQKIWLSKAEAMAYLGCSDKFLVTLRDHAEIMFARWNNTIWYDLRSIDRFLNRNKVG